MTNITVANFADGSHVTRTGAVYQYDYGQILQFSGLDLPSAYEVHFSNQESLGTSKTSIGNEDGVVIPDEYLLSGEKVYAWIFLHEGLDDGETEYKITIPVNKRARPTDIEPTPVQQDVITQTIAELNSAVEKVSQAVANSPKIEDGTWHVWDADNEVWVDTGVKAEGIDGTDGVDGVSPVISTEPIENGHKITFTDKEGTHVITLVNGAKGDTGPAGATGPAGPKGDTGDTGPKGETGATGPKGDTGSAGPQGERGTDGVSPTVAVTPITGGHSVAITDGTGTKSFDVLDGQDGQDGQSGQDGFSPSASVSKSGTVTTITVTDKNGTTTAQVNDGQNGQSGQDGQPGADGYSPSASVSKSGTVSTLTVTDKTGTTTVQINDGQDGQPGQDGQDGITPTTTVTTITGGHNVAFSYGSGDSRNTDFDVMNGQDGTDGYTPVKGTDYWTAADQAAIVQDVLASQEIAALQTKAITDAGGYYTTDTVEGALQEIGAEIAGVNTLIGTGVIS